MWRRVGKVSNLADGGWLAAIVRQQIIYRTLGPRRPIDHPPQPGARACRADLRQGATLYTTPLGQSVAHYRGTVPAVPGQVLPPAPAPTTDGRREVAVWVRPGVLTRRI